MTIVTGEAKPALPAERSCVACKEPKPADQFEMIRDARGKHARRRICMSCIAAVDAHVAAGTSTDGIVAAVAVSRTIVQERLIFASDTTRTKITPGQPAAATKTCIACNQRRSVHRFGVMPTTEAPRRICDLCFDQVDTLLRDGTPITVISAATRVAAPTVAARRDELGIPRSTQRLSASQRAAIIALAEAGQTQPSVIAAEVGEKADTVRRLLTREGFIQPNPALGPVSPELLATAKTLLEDGTPYAEAARTTGIGMKTLARHFPGMGGGRENKALIAWINANAAASSLQRELTRGVSRAR